MAAYEGNLKVKEVQLAKLILLYNDAEKARTAAKMELDEVNLLLTIQIELLPLQSIPRCFFFVDLNCSS